MKTLMKVITATLLVLTLCNRALSLEIGYGEIENGRYINDYFNMSLEVPSGWDVQSKAAIKEMSDRGGELIAGEDENLKAVLKEAEKQTINLFAFFKYEIGFPVNYNPSIAAVAERVTHMPGIKRGSDYLFHVKNIFKAGKVKYSFPKEMYTKSISGVSFDVMPAEISFANRSIYQEYYATKINGYMLAFILSYSSESELKELTQAINKLKFSE